MRILKKLKAKDTLFYAAVLCGYIAFAFLMVNAYFNAEKQTMAKSRESFPTIVIDPGHGGMDSGASNYGVHEKDINLEISKKLSDLLKTSGYKVVMTRDEDESIHDDNANTVRQQKVSDIKNRTEIVNSDPNNILVSIHQNKFQDSKYSGAQMFFSKNNPKSKDLAISIKTAIQELVQPENEREIKPAEKNIYILNKANVPAVIVECGFLSNEEELKNLTNSDYQSKLAFAIYCGILNYHNSI